MGMSSAAEARLSADIRPQITVLRSRSSYPARKRPPAATSGPAGVGGERSLATLAAGAARPGEPAPGAGGTSAASVRLVRQPAPIRLTRRGRVVVGAVVIMAAVAAAGLLWLAVAGRAQASSHVRPGQTGSQGMMRVVVQPGQTLWSIAMRAEPTADPRIVIQQIVDASALGGTMIQPGEVLWVPRG